MKKVEDDKLEDVRSQVGTFQAKSDPEAIERKRLARIPKKSLDERMWEIQSECIELNKTTPYYNYYSEKHMRNMSAYDVGGKRKAEQPIEELRAEQAVRRATCFAISVTCMQMPVPVPVN